MNFNPTIKEFLKKNPDLTVIGLCWAGWWRLYVCILGAYAVIGVCVGLFAYGATL